MQGLKYLFSNTAHANICNSDLRAVKHPLPKFPREMWKNFALFSFMQKIMDIDWICLATQFVTLPNSDLVTAHSSLIAAQMGSVTLLF